MIIEKRNIVTCVILSFVTCGIYAIYWAYKMAVESVKVKDANDPATLEAILCILLPFIGFFLAEKKFAEGCQAIGFPHEDRSVIYLVLGLFGLGIVNFCLMQSDLNRLSDAMVQ